MKLLNIILMVSIILALFTSISFAQHEIITIEAREGNNIPFFTTGYVWLGDLPPAIGIDTELYFVNPNSPEYGDFGVYDAVENVFIDTSFNLHSDEDIYSDRTYKRLINYGYIPFEHEPSPLILASDNSDESASFYYLDEDNEPQLIENAPDVNHELVKVNYPRYAESFGWNVLCGTPADTATQMTVFDIDPYYNYSFEHSYITEHPDLQCAFVTNDRWNPEYLIYSFEPPNDLNSGWRLGYRRIDDSGNIHTHLELPENAIPSDLIGARCSQFFNGLAWIETRENSNGIGYYIIDKDSTGFIAVENEIQRLEAYGIPINDVPIASYLVWTEITADSVFLRKVLVDENENDIKPVPDGHPENFAIQSAYPNPFNSSVRLGFNLNKAAKVELAIFDLLGRQIWSASNVYNQGNHKLFWNAGSIASGTYFAKWRLNSNQIKTQRLYLVK